MSRALRFSPLLLLVFPLALLAFSIASVIDNYTPAPFQDQWEIVWVWRKAVTEGRIPLDYWFSQHNEHRILFPRLILFADLKWFRGTNVLDLASILVVQLAGAALFLKAYTLRRPTWAGGLGLTTAVALIFSLAQWQNFFWGFQVQFVGVYVAAAWAIYLFALSNAAERPRPAVLLGALVLLFIATFTMSNGLLAGIAMVFIGLATRRRWRETIIVAATTIGLMALYFHGFAPSSHAPPAAPQAYVAYVLAYLGSLWAFTRPNWAVVAGAIGVMLCIPMALMVLTGRARDAARLAMFGIVLLVGMSACATALGRIMYGYEQALQSRYQTPAAWFWAAHALFWGLSAQELRRPVLRALAALPLLLTVALMPAVQMHGRAKLFEFRERILVASSGMLGGLDAPQSFTDIYPEPARVRDFEPFLRAHKLSVFAHGPSYRAGEQVPFAKLVAGTSCRGSFDLLQPGDTASGIWRALGWGWDLVADAPLERVLLAGGDGRIAGVALSGMPRGDVRKAVAEVDKLESGWIGLIQPQGPGPVFAYGLMADGHLCDLGRKDLPA